VIFQPSSALSIALSTDVKKGESKAHRRTLSARTVETKSKMRSMRMRWRGREEEMKGLVSVTSQSVYDRKEEKQADQKLTRLAFQTYAVFQPERPKQHQVLSQSMPREYQAIDQV
jgi:ubiquitin